jgi:hypothetical protein
MIGSRALLAAVIGVVALPVGGGCSDSAKSDGQIQASPEASNAAAAIGKSYAESMSIKYADKMKRKTPTRPTR